MYSLFDFVSNNSNVLFLVQSYALPEKYKILLNSKRGKKTATIVPRFPEPQESQTKRNENKRMEMQIEVDLICVFCSFAGQSIAIQHGKILTIEDWPDSICIWRGSLSVRQMILCILHPEFDSPLVFGIGSQRWLPLNKT